MSATSRLHPSSTGHERPQNSLMKLLESSRWKVLGWSYRTSMEPPGRRSPRTSSHRHPERGEDHPECNRAGGMIGLRAKHVKQMARMMQAKGIKGASSMLHL